jgi:hypothetical protein
MSTVDGRSLRAALKALLNQQVPKPHPSAEDKKRTDEIVSRRDERGMPHPGDFPNPASDRTRGCF